MRFSRRSFLQAAGAGLLLQTRLARGQQTSSTPPPQPVSSPVPPARVSLVHGDNRRRIVHDALLAIDDQIQTKLNQKKYVVIKPNNTSTVNALASTHADALRGILDYLEPRFKGPVVIAESSAGETWEGYENFYYTRLVSEYRARKVSLVDLNQEAKYELAPVIDEDLHAVPARVAARLLDPEAFVICSAILKTHNVVVATLAVKNMVVGAALHSAPGETPRWHDKRKYHGGVRQTNYSLFLTAQKLQPNWGVALIDGFEGMEGNGPASGNPVASRIAIASTDFVAADRVGVEAMAIDPSWVGYLQYCGQFGLGHYDLAKIDILGTPIAKVRKQFRLHSDIDRQLQWMGPMNELPLKLGQRTQPTGLDPWRSALPS